VPIERRRTHHELADAVKADDAAKVGAMVAAGADVKAGGGSSWLVVAIKHRAMEAFAALIAAGASASALHEGHSLVWLAITTAPPAVVLAVVRAREAATPLLPPAHAAVLADESGDAVRAAAAAAAATGASDGDAAAVAGALSAAAPDEDGGFTALHLAVALDRPAVAGALAAAGADKEAVDVNGNTPLLLATRRERWACAEALMRAGCNVRAANVWGCTVAHHVACCDNTLLPAVLAAGVDVHAVTEDGSTVLHWAAECGMVRHAELLLAAGCEVDAVRTEHSRPFTPLQVALKEGHEAVALLLAKAGACPHPEPDWRGDYDYPSVLAVACGAGEEALVDRLLDEGVDVHVATGEKHALVRAVAGGHASIARKLLALDAGLVMDPRNRNSSDIPWVMQCAIGGAVELADPACLEVLVRGMPAAWRFEALQLALCERACSTEALAWLAAEVVGMSATPDQMAALLTEVAVDLRSAALSALIAAGVSVTPASRVHLTLEQVKAATAAMVSTRQEDMEALPHDTTLLHACLHRYEVNDGDAGPTDDTIAVLLRAGFDLEARLADGRTPLLVACQRQPASVVSALIARGASPHARATGLHNFSALHLAAYGWRPRTVEVIVAAGVAANVRCDGGVTPLHVAVVGQIERCHMVSALLGAGAHVNATTELGVTPLHLACEADCPKRVSTLLAAGADYGARDVSGHEPVQWLRHDGKRTDRITQLLRQAASPYRRRRAAVVAAAFVVAGVWLCPGQAHPAAAGWEAVEVLVALRGSSGGGGVGGGGGGGVDEGEGEEGEEGCGMSVHTGDHTGSDGGSGRRSGSGSEGSGSGGDGED
jgi:ankyrin repeat protein